MIFRTGSVLIVGNCNETTLKKVYVFVKQILLDNYKEIYTRENIIKKKIKKVIIRKRIIYH